MCWPDDFSDLLACPFICLPVFSSACWMAYKAISSMGRLAAAPAQGPAIMSKVLPRRPAAVMARDGVDGPAKGTRMQCLQLWSKLRRCQTCCGPFCSFPRTQQMHGLLLEGQSSDQFFWSGDCVKDARVARGLKRAVCSDPHHHLVWSLVFNLPIPLGMKVGDISPC